jgi:hypothetical protein
VGDDLGDVAAEGGHEGVEGAADAGLVGDGGRGGRAQAEGVAVGGVGLANGGQELLATESVERRAEVLGVDAVESGLALGPLLLVGPSQEQQATGEQAGAHRRGLGRPGLVGELGHAEEAVVRAAPGAVEALVELRQRRGIAGLGADDVGAHRLREEGVFLGQDVEGASELLREGLCLLPAFGRGEDLRAEGDGGGGADAGERDERECGVP